MPRIGRPRKRGARKRAARKRHEVNAVEQINTVGEWIKMNLDTGCAVTSFPMSFQQDSSSSNGAQYRTASGEIIPDGGEVLFKGYDENRRLRSLGGRAAPVHKVLCSAGAMATNS